MTEVAINRLPILCLIFSPKGFQVLSYKFGMYSPAANCTSGHRGHSINRGHFKKYIENLTYYNSLTPNPQVYSKPCQTSKMERFGEIVTYTVATRRTIYKVLKTLLQKKKIYAVVLCKFCITYTKMCQINIKKLKKDIL